MKNKTSKPTPIGGVPAALKHIEIACDFFAIDYSRLIDQATRLDRELNIVRGNHMPIIRDQAATVARNRAQLHELIDHNRSLFQKPRTRTFSDVKVGLQKQPGRIEIADKEQTIERIKKLCPERLDDLAPAAREPRKEAFANLPADLLKKLGVTVTADTDAVIIKPMDSDVEKAVAALLKESQPELKAAA